MAPRSPPRLPVHDSGPKPEKKKKKRKSCKAPNTKCGKKGCCKLNQRCRNGACEGLCVFIDTDEATLTLQRKLPDPEVQTSRAGLRVD